MNRTFISLGFALLVGLFFLALGVRNAPARFTGRVAFEINWDLAPVFLLNDQDQAAKLQAVRSEVLGVLTGPWPEKDQLRLVNIANPPNRSSTGLVRPNVKVTAKDPSKQVSHVFIEVGHADPDVAGALVEESLSIAKRLTQSHLGKLPVVQPMHVMKNSPTAYWIATAAVSCVRALLAGGLAWLGCAVWAKLRGSRSVPPPLPPQLSR
jgi:hypothetical protein